ncbi:MAG: FecR domain-containing protein [Chitinophagaceae bacterium]|nr:FecR domain-containing protein [Chitinophagaceae bacterium]
MQKSFTNVDEMIGDESFLAWFYKEDEQKVNAWENWLANNPAYRAMADEAMIEMEALNMKEDSVSSFRVEAAYEDLNTRIAAQEQDSAPVVSMKQRNRRWWIGVAAAAVILAVSVSFFKYSSSKPVIETHYGQVSKQELPDGSQVMLNANTVVTLSNGWKEGEDREVWLKGEAFFQVKKSPQKNRFIVHTDQLDVIVTGTQFNVSTIGEKTSVLLTEGSVTIRTADGQEMLMKPGDYVEINNNRAEKKPTNLETVLAWKENKLNFENTPMKEVAVMINNHYGVTVNLADESIGEKKITGMMSNTNLNDLLNALEATTEFKITRTDNTILIAKP